MPERVLTVLVVDDDSVVRTVVQQLLERRGHQVRAVENGRLAVEALEQGTFDCVIMDVEMPVMDGVTATGTIRASERERASRDHVRIVGLTGGGSGGGARCLDAGMDAFVAKPFSRPTDLYAAVEQT